MVDVAYRRTATPGITPAPLLIVVVLLVSALTGMARAVQVGPISALGAFSLLAIVAALLMWLALPVIPRSAIPALWWMLPLLLWIATEAAMITPTFLGIQNNLVLLGFFALILLTAREAHRSTRFVGAILPRAFHAALWIALLAYLITIPRYGFNSKELVNARGFADFALVGLAWLLPEARAGKRSSRLLTLIILALLVASLSRLATAIALVMIAVAQLDWSSHKSKVKFFAGVVIGAAIFLYSINSFAPLRDRFFRGDVSFQVAGVTINGEGRTEMWAVTLASAKNSLISGNGAGSSATLIKQVNGLDHPHNDYLRILHDYGLIGLSLWLIALLVIISTLFKRWRAASRDPRFRWTHVHQAAFLAILGFVISMIANNPVVYPFVMLPLGVLVGCSLGTPTRQSRE